MNIRKYYHTLKHLRANQLWWQMKYRFKRRWRVSKRAVAPRGPAPRLPLDKACEFLWGAVSDRYDPVDNRFVLLNETVSFGQRVDWSAAGCSRLWGFRLNAFDYLGRTSFDDGMRLMLDWILECRVGIGWEAAPVSCRIINWIKFLADRAPRETGAEGMVSPELLGKIGASLFIQADWLARNTERHIRGNHLLKNGVALLYAGLFLGRPRFVAQGASILEETLDEQFLTDGGHYERSTMYHALVCHDLLDCLNLRGLPGALRQRILERIGPGLEFLSAMCHEDGRISLFNDSVFNMAPDPERLFRYATEITGRVTTPPAGKSMEFFADSGYLVLSAREGRLIADVGPVGPDSFPAHAHCDLLSFELSLNGQRVIVDSGNFDYQRSEMRKYARGTRAHNTIMVDGRDQSDMWDIFRVGRRARPLSAEPLADGSGCTRFLASHDGYAHDGNIVHSREFIRFREGIFLIIDRITGKGRHDLVSSLHFHPDCRIRQGAEGAKRLTVSTKGGDLHVHAALTSGTARLETGWYCPEFNVRRPQTVLAIHLTDKLPVTMVTCVGSGCEGPVSVDLARRALYVNGSCLRWPASEKEEEREAICVS